MLTWTLWKNRQGARRSDGLHLRRAWGWYSRWTRPAKSLKGWDLNEGLTILGTFPDQPLGQVMAKVDALLPKGKRRPLGPFRYANFDCPSCKGVAYVKGLPFGKGKAVCPHCSETIEFRAWDFVRELELHPEQKLVTFTGERLDDGDGDE